MSALWNLTSHVIVAPASALIDNLNEFTYLMWVHPIVQAQFNRFWGRGVGEDGMQWSTATDDEITVVIVREGGEQITITNENFSRANTDFWVAVTYSDTDDTRVFFGDLATPTVEATYASRDTGGGAHVAQAAQLHVGNRSTLASAFQGRFGHFSVHNKRFSLDAIEEHRLCPFIVPGITELFYDVGTSGTATQLDKTTNGLDGTMDVASLADHPPLPCYVMASQVTHG